jgi:hypothetical protein
LRRPHPLLQKTASPPDVLGEKYFGALASLATTGVSALTPYATIVGARAANDRSATNVAQIVISGTKRSTAQDDASMPAFGAVYSDVEIAAVTNYVTGRFGSEQSTITAKDLAETAEPNCALTIYIGGTAETSGSPTLRARPRRTGGRVVDAARGPELAHRVGSLRCNTSAAIEGIADLAAHPTACL